MDHAQDHARRTVTVDTHPHLGIPAAFIHPCMHSDVMKKLIDRQSSAPRVDRYLFTFLKFIASAIPEIEYDFTMETET